MFYQYLLVFLVSLVPGIELRGAIPVGMTLGLPRLSTTVVSVIGNLLIVPLVLYTFDAFLRYVGRFPSWRKFVDWVCRQAEKHKKQIVKDGEAISVSRLSLGAFFGLLFFVLIPCPGTGAWSGSIVAVLFGFPKKSAAVAIGIGVLGCAAVMNLIMSGVLSFLQFLI